MTGLALDHVGLAVADLSAQSAWYQRALGLTPVNPFSIDALGLSGVFLVDATGWSIELLHRVGGAPGPRATDAPDAALIHGYGHLCLRVDDVDGLHDRLVGAGGTSAMTPQDAPEPGVRMAFVCDPEGNLIELIDRKGPAGS